MDWCWQRPGIDYLREGLDQLTACTTADSKWTTRHLFINVTQSLFIGRVLLSSFYFLSFLLLLLLLCRSKRERTGKTTRLYDVVGEKAAMLEVTRIRTNILLVWFCYPK